MFRSVNVFRRRGAPRSPAAVLAALLASLLGAAPALAAPPPAGTSTAAVPRRVVLATSEPVSIVAGTPVQFQDSSLGTPTSWSWDFSYDALQPEAASTEQNPVWTFAEAGVWPVRLEVCNAAGCSAAVKEVTVVEPCASTADLLLPDPLGSILDLLVTYEACQSITTSGALSIVQGGDVTFRAGRRIVLGDGFSVGGGGRFVAEIDPALDAP